MKARILEGDYSPDDLARFLLAAAGSHREAKKALTRASNKKPLRRATDGAMVLAAYALQKKLKCRDHTALKKLMGGKYRSLYDRLKAKDLTLKQAAQLVQNAPHKF